jgi:hypothetical protein
MSAGKRCAKGERGPRFTRRELDAIASWAEMVGDGSGCTLGDWSDVNGSRVADRVRQKIAAFDAAKGAT